MGRSLLNGFVALGLMASNDGIANPVGVQLNKTPIRTEKALQNQTMPSLMIEPPFKVGDIVHGDPTLKIIHIFSEKTIGNTTFGPIFSVEIQDASGLRSMVFVDQNARIYTEKSVQIGSSNTKITMIEPLENIIERIPRVYNSLTKREPIAEIFDGYGKPISLFRLLEKQKYGFQNIGKAKFMQIFESGRDLQFPTGFKIAGNIIVLEGTTHCSEMFSMPCKLVMDSQGKELLYDGNPISAFEFGVQYGSSKEDSTIINVAYIDKGGIWQWFILDAQNMKTIGSGGINKSREGMVPLDEKLHLSSIENPTFGLPK